MEKYALKAERESAIQKEKIKKALLQGNHEGARIYAENSIRKHNEGNGYLRMASRVNAVQARVQTAMTMNSMVKNIKGVTKELESAMQSMDLEQVERIMSKFETTFENLDVHSSTMENSMGNAVTLTAPEAQVSSLIKQIADEHGLEIKDAVSGAPIAEDSAATSEPTKTRDDALSRRLQIAVFRQCTPIS
ncbi:unnamed protein product [Protopolystoma xenopodis]|uniref:Uncharacterized protein n=1 Tax=Protopolystoma xenopodis TaxID=117903 RepID=A0A448WUN0_9PLAT|nr:unnamed protein product [Protopolystoma xenopodis]